MKLSRGKENKKIRMVSVLTLTTLAVVGCNSSNGKDQTGDAGQSSAPTKISVMAPLFAAQPPSLDDSNVGFKLLQEKTSTKLDITFIPNATYNDKFNVTLASGALPQVVVALRDRDAAVVNAVKAGAFWEVGPYLKDFPNIQKYWNPAIGTNMSVDGKVYGIYRSRATARNGIIFRQDWLDNLGLKTPVTVDDFYNVLKAFTLNDPDKNGKNDTFGLTTADDNIESAVRAVSVAFGGVAVWGVRDGKVVPDFMTQEYLDALKLFNRLYNEKLMNQDFGVVKGVQRYASFNKSQSGMFFGAMGDANTFTGDLFKLVPSASVNVSMGFDGGKGIKVIGGAGYNGVYMFPKSSIKSEAELKKILSYFEKSLDPEVVKLLSWGVEGVHYKVDNGNYVWTNQALFRDQVADLSQTTIGPAGVEWPGDSDLVKRIKKLQNDYEKTAVMNAIEPLTSETNNEKGGELRKMMDDARTQFIMGKVDEPGFKKIVEDWRKKGGDKIIEEFTADYNKTKK